MDRYGSLLLPGYKCIHIYITYIYMCICITICAVKECCNVKSQLVGVDDHGYPHLFHPKCDHRSLLRRARKPLEIQLGSRDSLRSWSFGSKKKLIESCKLDPISTSWTHIDIVLYHIISFILYICLFLTFSIGRFCHQ